MWLPRISEPSTTRKLDFTKPEPLSTAALAWQDRAPLLRFGRMAAGISSLLGHIASAYLHPCRASLTKSAWEARALRRRSLAMARAANDPEETEALATILVRCEALRSNLPKALILLRETSDVR